MGSANRAKHETRPTRWWWWWWSDWGRCKC